MKKTLLRLAKANQVRANFAKCLTIKKIVNYLKFENDLRKKKIITSSFPPVITFQPSGYCNTNCQLCPVGLGINGPRKGFMDLADFRKIFNEAKDYLIQIAFAGWGEPFLNPAIFDMILHAETNKVLTHASTNLHVFKNENDLKMLLNSGLSFLTVSLHGLSQDTYEAYQPGKIFSETISKLVTLVTLRNKMRLKKPRIDLAFAVTKKNQHEVENVLSFAEKIGVDKDVYTASLNLRFYFHDRNKIGQIIDEWAQDRKIGFSDLSALEKERINELYEAILVDKNVSTKKLDQLRLTARHFCLDPWKTLTVNWDGTVSICCTDYSGYIMGNAVNESVIGIWNNLKYQKLRKYMLHGSFAKKGVDFPCAKCIKY